MDSGCWVSDGRFELAEVPAAFWSPKGDKSLNRQKPKLPVSGGIQWSVSDSIPFLTPPETFKEKLQQNVGLCPLPSHRFFLWRDLWAFRGTRASLPVFFIMDWLRSWVQTPEQRCTEAVQKILTAGELSDSEWSTFHGDVVKDEIPNSLIAGLPSLLEALQGREAEGRSSPVTRCALCPPPPHLHPPPPPLSTSNPPHPTSPRPCRTE